MLMRGSQIVMECLLEQGVDTVFGYPGGTILNIYDEFELHGYNQKIHHYLTAHEQGASHAADRPRGDQPGYRHRHRLL